LIGSQQEIARNEHGVTEERIKSHGSTSEELRIYDARMHRNGEDAFISEPMR
jgi:hypothetical protein